MRKYTIPQSMSVEYLLTDHIGSTSLTTDSSGARVSELRYSPFGEIRYSWTANLSTTPPYTPTRYTFTGQYSYMDDPAPSASQGFGLMFYVSRWYDPSLGRFVQADTLIPESTQGTQAWDRYAYVNNNPVRYTDPTGHMMDQGDGGCTDEADCTPPLPSIPTPSPTPLLVSDEFGAKWGKYLGTTYIYGPWMKGDGNGWDPYTYTWSPKIIVENAVHPPLANVDQEEGAIPLSDGIPDTPRITIETPKVESRFVTKVNIFGVPMSDGTLSKVWLVPVITKLQIQLTWSNGSTTQFNWPFYYIEYNNSQVWHN